MLYSHMADTERHTELRIVVRSEMTDEELNSFIDGDEGVVSVLREHLIDGEEVLTALYTDKISYESRQLLKEMGVE